MISYISSQGEGILCQTNMDNHYVPEWYQKRFIDPLSKDKALYRLDLDPDIFYNSKGKGIKQIP